LKAEATGQFAGDDPRFRLTVRKPLWRVKTRMFMKNKN